MASRPFSLGIEISVIIMSGSSRCAASTSACPSVTVPTTSPSPSSNKPHKAFQHFWVVVGKKDPWFLHVSSSSSRESQGYRNHRSIGEMVELGGTLALRGNPTRDRQGQNWDSPEGTG